MIRRGGVTCAFLTLLPYCFAHAGGARTSPPSSSASATLPDILIIRDLESSGEGFREPLDRIAMATREAMFHRGLPLPEVFALDSPSVKRALSERTLRPDDLAHSAEPDGARRLCQGLSRRVGLVLRVVRAQGTSAEPDAIELSNGLVDTLFPERIDTFQARADVSELVPDAKGKKPSIYDLVGRKIAVQSIEIMAKWPPVTDEVRIGKAEERIARAKERGAMRDYAGAIDEVNQAIALAPRESRYYRFAGDFYAEAGDLDLALLQYRRSLGVSPDDGATRVRLARLLAQKGNLLEAAREAQRSIQTGPETPDARLIIARALLIRRDGIVTTQPDDAQALLDEAVKHLQRAVELKPEDTDLVAELADLLTQNRRYVQAAEQWARVVQSKPQDAQARERLAIALYSAKNYDEAFQVFKASIDLKPKPARLDADLYRRVARMLDMKTIQIFEATLSVMKDFESEKAGREAATLRLQKIRNDETEIQKMLRDIVPPDALLSSIAHRKLSYTLFDQAISSYLLYLDTGDSLDRDRGRVLQTQATTEYNIAYLGEEK